MPFADENFFYQSGNPEMDEFVAQQLGQRSAPKQSKKPAQYVGGQTFGSGGTGMYDNGFGYAMGGFNTAMGISGMQGSMLNGILGATQNAISDENDSRVAQMREWRRMEHEKAIMQQRMALEKMRLDNERFRDQTDAANEIRKLKYASWLKKGGVGFKQLKKDPMTGEMRWFDEWEM